MPSSQTSAWDLVIGGVLHCFEAATLGLPLEVWKTRQGRFRDERALESFRNVYREGGGAKAFWAGFSPKLVEASLKGSVLLFSKELLSDGMRYAGAGETLTGFVAGFGGGVAQTIVIAPCAFFVTAAVTGGGKTMMDTARDIYGRKGVLGFYEGASAIAARQGSNWAMRQGFTDAARHRMRLLVHGREDAKLSIAQDSVCSMIGGTLATCNQPFEVARIEAQSAAVAGEPSRGLVGTMQLIVRQNGVAGLFKGLIPRIGLGIWQTLIMVTGSKIVKAKLMPSKA
mmetsp:Transcript_19292/g.65366  ORF Transcript_19292/g.65366 Transcript_19292/m.65366 type:complete len:284 (+) Transcript_19292:169-1020(+)